MRESSSASRSRNAYDRNEPSPTSRYANSPNLAKRTSSLPPPPWGCCCRPCWPPPCGYIVCSCYRNQYFVDKAFESKSEAVEELESIVEDLDEEFDRRRETLYLGDDSWYEVRQVSLEAEEEDPRNEVRW